MDELEAILETGGAAAVEIAASALVERGGVAPKCPNCGHPMIGPYCAICGQPHDTHRRTLGHLAHDFFKDIINFDSRILRTARALLVQPGELPRAFREGRTQRYMPAVRLYLFVSLLFFLFLAATGIALVQFGVQVEKVRYVHDSVGQVYAVKNGKKLRMEGFRSDANGKVWIGDGETRIQAPSILADGRETNDFSTRVVFFRPVGSVNLAMPAAAKDKIESIKKQTPKAAAETNWLVRGFYATLTKLETDPAALNGPLLTWIPRILFFLLPVFAVLLAAFYFRKRHEFYFVDHLTFSLTIHTFTFVVLIGAAAIAQAIDGTVLLPATCGVIALYLFLSLKWFYGQRWLTTSLKFVGITFIYTFFFVLPALGFALFASFVGV